MKTTTLVIENATKSQAKEITKIYNHYLDHSNGVTVDEMESAMQFAEILFDGVKVGRGDNHVWITNSDNQRIAIVEIR